MEGYEEVKKMADTIGVSVRKLCEMSGVNYRAIHRWKNKNPMSMDTFGILKKTTEHEIKTISKK